VRNPGAAAVSLAYIVARVDRYSARAAGSSTGDDYRIEHFDFFDLEGCGRGFNTALRQ